MQLTAADRVTLFRAGLGAVLAVLVLLMILDTWPQRSWLFVAIAVPTLLLDAVDGYVARRWDCVTARGAVLDGEVDAGVVLVLSLAAAFTLGPWVLLIGLARYLYAAAALIWPWLETPLPPSRLRKAVAAAQGMTLTAALAPITPTPLGSTVVALAAASLAVSFLGQAVEAHGHRETGGSDKQVSRLN